MYSGYSDSFNGGLPFYSPADSPRSGLIPPPRSFSRFEDQPFMPRGGGGHPQQYAHGHYAQSHAGYGMDYQAEQWLRNQGFLRGLPAHLPVHLDSLQDSKASADRPPYTMVQLAAVAIMSHPRKRASSSEIRDMLMRRFRFFNENPKELGETLKHALSSYDLFRRVERTVTEPGRGGLWELDVLTNPTGRRARKRGPGETYSHESSPAGDDFFYGGAGPSPSMYQAQPYTQQWMGPGYAQHR